MIRRNLLSKRSSLTNKSGVHTENRAFKQTMQSRRPATQWRGGALKAATHTCIKKNVHSISNGQWVSTHTEIAPVASTGHDLSKTTHGNEGNRGVKEAATHFKMRQARWVCCRQEHNKTTLMYSKSHWLHEILHCKGNCTWLEGESTFLGSMAVHAFE